MESLTQPAVLAAVAATFGLTVAILTLSQLSPALLRSPRPSTPSERTFTSPTTSKSANLPSLVSDDPTCRLSVIVPAYNESLRLPSMLSDALSYLSSNYSQKQYEIIIVDDGSRDDTFATALSFAKANIGKGGENIKLVKLVKNRGKGGAVRHGMLHASGERCLFVDADGASSFPDLAKLISAMDELTGVSSSKSHKPVTRSSSSKATTNGHANGSAAHNEAEPPAIVLGSRAHMVSSPAVVQRSALRNALMKSFHLYLALLGIAAIKDTQCGFKLFTRSAAKAIFPSQHTEGWIFDIEILIIASLLGDVKLKEVPIEWKEVDGSKMSLVRDSISMALDLLVIRASYAVGRWKVARKDVQ